MSRQGINIRHVAKCPPVQYFISNSDLTKGKERCMERNALARWVDGFHFEVFSHTGKKIRLDGWKDREREETGPTPGELIPMSLVACTGMDVILILEKQKLEITGFEVEVESVTDDEYPKAFRDFQITYHLRGENLDPGKVERAIALSRDKYCIISITLEKAATFSHFYTINGGETREVPHAGD